MLRFELKLALDEFEAKTGLRITYESLAQRTGMSVDTVKSIATRRDYNASLKNISEICKALKADPLKYLIWNELEGDGNE